MGTSLPIYIDTAVSGSGALPAAEPVTATLITDAAGRGCGGSLIRGFHGILASTGGIVTVNIYDGPTVATARQYYSVALDFTTLTQTSDTQGPGIPALKDVYVTLTGDATAATKAFAGLAYLQKLSIGS